MSQRDKDAQAIIAGACNPQAIVRAIDRAFYEIRTEPGFRGTDSYTGDPAVRLMVHQLWYICGGQEIENDIAVFQKLSDDIVTREPPPAVAPTA